MHVRRVQLTNILLIVAGSVPLTTIILLAAVGMTGLWWWQNYQKSNEERDNLVQTYVEKEKTAEVPVTHSNEIPVAINSQPATSNNGTAPVAGSKK